MSVWDKKRDIMRRYDVTARIYDMRYADEQAAKIEAALRHVVVKAGVVLDVGCGTGILFSYVADKARMTVGVDVSMKTLLKAKERARNHASVHLVWADADNMPLRDKVFDRVFAITLIQNMPRQTETLNEIRRVVKDDALIVVTGLKKVFTRSKLEQLLKNAGLKIIAMRNEGLKCYVAVCTKA
jgi:ubiquinone/menaquinone biosynthesis C-methylase UbiE